MNPTQTGIATALALVVVIMFFILPGLSPFGQPQPQQQAAAAAAADQSAQTLQAAEQPAEAANTTTTMPTEITQLMMKDDVVGTGAVATAGDSVTVNYVGALTNGTVFDASANHGSAGFTFKLGAGQVIKGWDQGVAGMKEGGKRTLLIPASLAYGNQAVGNAIPANSALIFQVELVKVQKGAK